MNPHFRERVIPDDVEHVRSIAASTGFFSTEEVELAVGLIRTRLELGIASAHEFLFAEQEGHVAGFTCYGPIPRTLGSYRLDWIAVHRHFRGVGLGRVLLFATEQRIAKAGGRKVYAETSGRVQYLPIRGFYEACGYIAEATLTDFYAPGDDKVIHSKSVALVP